MKKYRVLYTDIFGENTFDDVIADSREEAEAFVEATRDVRFVEMTYSI